MALSDKAAGDDAKKGMAAARLAAKGKERAAMAAAGAKEGDEEFVMTTPPKTKTEERQMLEGLRDTVSVVSEKPSAGNLRMLADNIVASTSTAMANAEALLGFDSEVTFARKTRIDLDAFYAAVVVEIDSYPSPTPSPPEELADAATMALRHVTPKGVLNTNKARKGLLLAFLETAPDELKKVFETTVHWNRKMQRFDRPDRLYKLRAWLKTTVGMATSDEDGGPDEAATGAGTRGATAAE
eukprot:1963027-Rhodomonas_salina.1